MSKDHNLNIEIQHRFIEKLTDINRELRLINGFSKLIQEATGFNKLIIELLKRFDECYRYIQADCYELDRRSLTLIHRYQVRTGEAPITVAEENQRIEVDAQIVKVSLDGELIKEVSNQKGFPNRLILPVKHQEIGVVGVLVISCDFECTESNLNVNTLKTVTDMVAAKLVELRTFEQIKKYQRRLEEYVHVVSHDLKSPLRSLSALNSWIKEDLTEDYCDKVKGHFQRMDEVLEHMELMISSTLNYSKLDYDRVELLKVDTKGLLKQVINSVVVPEHVEVRVPKNLPMIKSHDTKLKQIFQNLLSNAIKFNDKPKGLIEFNYHETERHHYFSVRDNGMGIDQKYFSKIFEVFQSLDKREGSTGVGLSIVKKLVNQLGGELCVDSVLTEYTCFHFSLPKH